MRTVVAVAASLLLAGGIALVVFGLRATRKATVARLRAVLGDEPDIVDEDEPPLAALWAQLTRAADRAGRGSAVFTRFDRLLERAGWLLRPAEFLVLLVLAAAGGALVATVLTGVGLGSVVGLVAGPLVLLGIARSRAEKLTSRVDDQLPDVLDQLASSMRSGYSLTQAIEAVADDGAAPLGPQLARVLAETQVGRPLDDALQAMAERVDSTDLSWTVRAMIIQARTGGKLSDILEVLGEFMREREEVRREVKALTADGRISAAVLIALPFFVTGAILFTRPEYLQPLIVEPLGRVMLAGAAVFMTFGIVLIRKMVKVEV